MSKERGIINRLPILNLTLENHPKNSHKSMCF